MCIYICSHRSTLTPASNRQPKSREKEYDGNTIAYNVQRKILTLDCQKQVCRFFPLLSLLTCTDGCGVANHIWLQDLPLHIHKEVLYPLHLTTLATCTNRCTVCDHTSFQTLLMHRPKQVQCILPLQACFTATPAEGAPNNSKINPSLQILTCIYKDMI